MIRTRALVLRRQWTARLPVPHLFHSVCPRPNKEPTKVILKLKSNRQIYPDAKKEWERKLYLDSLPTLMRNVRETMDRYKGYIVITQVGSFYELYFEHATEIAPRLNITLTKKTFKEFTVPMAGFPLSQLDRHLKVLVKDLNMGVAVSEQFQRETSIDNDPVKIARRVTRVISPGTLVDEAFLNEQENNYLLVIDIPKNSVNRPADPDIAVGLAWIDISVGTLFVQEVTLEGLASAISRIKPSEILLSEDLVEYRLESGDWYQELIELNKYFVKYQNLPARHKTLDLFYGMFNFTQSVIKKSFDILSVKEASAMKNLLNYIEEHFPETKIGLQLPEKQYPEMIMQIDSRTSDALELHKTYRDQLAKGSLLSCVRRTSTQGGARLLSQWLMAPSTNVNEILSRQKMVTVFFEKPIFRKQIVMRLKECHDISRIVQRFSMGRGSILDLVQLATTVQTFECIKEIINEKLTNDDNAIKSLPPIPESEMKLAKEILKDIDVEHLLTDLENQQKVAKEELESLASETYSYSTANRTTAKTSPPLYVIRKESSKTLKSLHDQVDALQQQRLDLEIMLRDKLKTEGVFKEVSLKLSPSLGYQVYIKGTKTSKYDDLSRLFPEGVLSQKSMYTRWYSYPKLTSLGHAIDAMRVRIGKEENNVVKSLIAKVIKRSIHLRNIGKFLDSLDVTSSFAILAHERGLVCPEVNGTTDLEIVDGRHLAVEDSLNAEMKRFTSNDLTLHSDQFAWIITGPNMGGKSTFLRQNAIIVILAQIGSYIPATRATIGVVDKMFSRVNSTDDLSNNMSTFMVEMVETSYILNGATDRSLAILDEIGRGTSSREGTAVAFATLNHLVDQNKSRILFSTHYGNEISRLIKKYQTTGIETFAFKKITAERVSGHLHFNRKLEDGISEQSYAIEVAEKAGFPPDAIAVAREVMNLKIENSH